MKICQLIKAPLCRIQIAAHLLQTWSLKYGHSLYSYSFLQLSQPCLPSLPPGGCLTLCNKTKKYCDHHTHTHLLTKEKPYARSSFLLVQWSKPLFFVQMMILTSISHPTTVDTNTKRLQGQPAQKVSVSRLSWGQFKLAIKSTCGVIVSFQAVVSSSKSVAYCVSLRLRQCANNYREPKASVCIWRRRCGVGGVCATVMNQAHRCN